jgi:hypothetical protein
VRDEHGHLGAILAGDKHLHHPGCGTGWEGGGEKGPQRGGGGKGSQRAAHDVVWLPRDCTGHLRPTSSCSAGIVCTTHIQCARRVQPRPPQYKEVSKAEHS